MMRIRNWKKFQHFKDRRPPWIKLYRDLLDDPDWHELSGDDAKSLTMLWLIASEHDGELPDSRKLAFRLRSTKVKIEQLLTRLSHWLEQDDIATISGRYQDDAPETETETETETEIYRSNWPKDFREQFWNAYPRKVGKKAAVRKLEAIRLSGEVEFPDLLRAISTLSASEERFLPHPTTWLNEGRYLDNLPPPGARAAPNESAANPPHPGMPTDAELRAKYAQRGEDEGTAAEGSGVLAGSVEVHPGESDGLGVDRSKLCRTQSMADVFCGARVGTICDETIEAGSFQEGDDASAMA